jgi:transposase InsO family protein
MKMSRSTYHYKSKKRNDEDEILCREIEAIIELLPESGYRPVTAKLREKMKINPKRVLRVMRKYQLLCTKTRGFHKKTTQSGHKLKKYPNLLKDTITDKPRQAIVGDVTAFDVCGVDHYLAHLMDIFSREVLGIAISDKNNTDLVLACLEDAAQCYPEIRGAIHHTDTDVRYCSARYIEAVNKLDLQISMTLGNVYENAHSESLNKTLKRQEININEYKNKKMAAQSIFRFRDIYNNQRPHSALGMLAPAVFTKNFKQENLNKGVQF